MVTRNGLLCTPNHVVGSHRPAIHDLRLSTHDTTASTPRGAIVSIVVTRTTRPAHRSSTRADGEAARRKEEMIGVRVAAGWGSGMPPGHVKTVRKWSARATRWQVKRSRRRLVHVNGMRTSRRRHNGHGAGLVGAVGSRHVVPARLCTWSPVGYEISGANRLQTRALLRNVQV